MSINDFWPSLWFYTLSAYIESVPRTDIDSRFMSLLFIEYSSLMQIEYFEFMRMIEQFGNALETNHD